MDIKREADVVPEEDVQEEVLDLSTAKRKGKIITCGHCKQIREHSARSLCRPCYKEQSKLPDFDEKWPSSKPKQKRISILSLKKGPCLCCKQVREHSARNLCGPCYRKQSKIPDFDEKYPAQTYSSGKIRGRSKRNNDVSSDLNEENVDSMPENVQQVKQEGSNDDIMVIEQPPPSKTKTPRQRNVQQGMCPPPQFFNQNNFSTPAYPNHHIFNQHPIQQPPNIIFNINIPPSSNVQHIQQSVQQVVHGTLSELGQYLPSFQTPIQHAAQDVKPSTKCLNRPSFRNINRNSNAPPAQRSNRQNVQQQSNEIDFVDLSTDEEESNN